MRLSRGCSVFAGVFMVRVRLEYGRFLSFAAFMPVPTAKILPNNSCQLEDVLA